MRVKIGDTWHDSADQPLAVQLTEVELEGIKQLTPDSNRSFASGSIEAADLLEWMRDGRDSTA